MTTCLVSALAEIMPALCLVHSRFRRVQLRFCDLDAALRLREFFLIRFSALAVASALACRRVKLLL